jgi:hypothetical protein
MAFKIKDGVRIGLVDVFASNGQLLVPAPSLITPRKIELTGDITGNVLFDGTANVQIATIIQPNSIELGTDTSGNYVENINPGTGITVSGGGTETANVTVTNSDRGSSQNIFKNIANGTGGVQITASTNDDTIRFAGGGGTGITFDSGSKTITINTPIPPEADTLQTVTTRGSTTANIISFTNGAASSNTTTGAIIVTGGVGISGALNVGGNISTATGVIATSVTTANIFNTTVTTLNLGGAATTVNIGAATGNTTINNNLVVSGDLTVSGNTTIVNTETLQVEDKNIEIGKVATPTDVTADTGGITLLGDTNKTIQWLNSTDAWTFSEHIDLASGKEFRINNTLVANSTSLGSGIVGSSLTSVGTITTGVWQGSVIGAAYGGTGQSTYSNGQILIGNNTGGLTKATITAGANITVTNGDGSITIGTTGLVSATDVITNTEIVDSSHVVGKLLTGRVFANGINALTTLHLVTGRGATTNNVVTLSNTTTSNSTAGALIVSGGISANDIFIRNEIRDAITITSSNTVTLATVSQTAIDTFPIATYRSGRYMIQITQGSNYQLSDFRILHNGTTTYITEYAVLESAGTELCTITADISSGTTARILATMGSATSAAIKINRTLFTV